MISGAAAARRRIPVTKQRLVECAARADARLGRRGDVAPQRRVVGEIGQVGAIAGRRRRREREQPVQLGLRDQRSLPVAFAQAPPADVVRQPLHHRPLERRGQQPGAVEHRAQAGQVDGGDLVLQRLGAGADHDLAPRQQRGDQVRQRLARARSGLDQQALVAVDGLGDPLRHRELSGARLVAGKQRRRGAAGPEQRTDALPRRLAAIVGRSVRGRGHRLRLAFSSMPDTPNRRRSSANTASVEHAGGLEAHQGVEDQVGRLVRDVRGVVLDQRLGQLARLLGDLGVDLRQPRVQQRHDVRLLRPLAPALGDHLGDARDHERGRIGGPVVGDQRTRRRSSPTPAVETRRRARVAGRPRGIAQVQHHVAVAVEAHLAHRQRVPRRLALAPGRLARSAPEVRGAGRQRRRERVAVRPREHAHHARARLLRDHRHQPVRVERDGREQRPGVTQRHRTLSRTGMPRARR